GALRSNWMRWVRRPVKLAENRAEKIAGYLENVWGIEKKRISVHSRLDPAVPSSSETPEGRQENRRVELDISQDGMYQPIQLRAVEPTTEPREIPFTISSAVSSGAIDRWRVEIIGRDSTFGVISGNGVPPSEISWPLTQNDRERVLNQRDVHYRLSVYDSAGRAVSTPAQSLPLLLDTAVNIASSPNRPDNTADFLLVTFDFDRAELTRRGREELRSIFGRIGPNSRVTIVGYTDPIGNTEHNRTLATDRARRVASMMPAGTTVESRGAGPEEAPYSSTSPEGRFLSRTVRVVVTNPK
ncbi:MAG: OmpA family protein, partial [Bacteroidota bacterium]